MAAFRYRAATADGSTQKGVLEAPSRERAVADLRARGLIPLDLKPLSQKKSGGSGRTRGFSFGSRVPRGLIGSTVRQLATLLQAGLPLDQALNLVLGGTRHAELRRILSDIRENIRQGGDLAGAFGAHPSVFGATFVTMVRAGESSGTLEIVMERLAEHMEQQARLRRKVRGAMAYPLLMLLVGLGVVVFMLAFVIPKVTDIFSDMQRTLPLPTRILLGVSDFMRDHWLLLVLAIVGIGLGGYAIARTAAGRKLLHRNVFRVPLLGVVARLLAVGRFSRTLGMLLKNGVPLDRALDIVKRITANVELGRIIGEVAKGVQQGHSLAAHLSDSGFFDETFVQLVAAGEQSGSLERMLLVVSDECDNRVEARLQVLTSLMEPVMILVMGALVGFIVMAIILPIFEMSSMVG
ncbi:type II secretion system F family protein [Pseudodesulfovibrio senegalensis]|uniref:General secretion pathway protein F n=1 Tax=Pseudodesulfovibrio senegalensis TaxID=1721087 RepID=A0A6N6N2Z7_9BACT|nr:type II secretion system F family protein [Pseudodesulfovibrio senegalensis]KAB1441416.1 type II secretion system F family protein [Pseudodesulfovibrio senegalensis]